MINDAHIHVGQFYQTYTTARMISKLMQRLGVDRYAVSSTTTCEKNYHKVCDEINDLIDIDGDRVFPVLWCSPEIFDDTAIMDDLINCGIKWCCLKIHPDWQPFVWSDNKVNQQNLLGLAHKLNVPILIHTGGSEYSEAEVWTSLIKDNPGQTFILAHLRPFNKALEIVANYGNAYGDLAFVDEDCYHLIHDHDVAKKIMWGSDVPIISHYLKVNEKDYYCSLLKSLEHSTTEEEYRHITKENFNRIFK